MKAKELTDLIHQTNGLWNSFPCRFLLLTFPFVMAPFSLNYRNRAPGRVRIIESYDACVGVISNCYTFKGNS